MYVNATEMEFIMQERKESMSTSDRVASFTVAAAVVVAVIVISVVGANTALSAASIAASEGPRKTQPAKDPAPEAHANYLSPRVRTPAAETAQPIARLRARPTRSQWEGS